MDSIVRSIRCSHQSLCTRVCKHSCEHINSEVADVFISQGRGPYMVKDFTNSTKGQIATHTGLYSSVTMKNSTLPQAKALILWLKLIGYEQIQMVWGQFRLLIRFKSMALDRIVKTKQENAAGSSSFSLRLTMSGIFMSEWKLLKPSWCSCCWFVCM